MTRLPLFPLHAVLLPGGLLPLRIFETRYLDMICECLRNGHGFVVCLIRSGPEVGGPAEVHDTGTCVEVVDWRQEDDGLLGILVQGEARVRVATTHAQADGLLIGEVEPLPDTVPVSLPPEFGSLVLLLEGLLDALGPPWDRVERRFDDAGWVGGRLTELLPLDLPLKQQILETDDPLVRLHRLRDAMAERGVK